MRTTLYIRIFLALLFFLSASAFAQTGAGAAKTGGGGTSTGRYEIYASSAFVGLGSGASQFDLTPGFQFVPFAKFYWLQVGGEIEYQKIGYRGGSTKNMLIMGGVTANLGGTTINDSFFGSLGLGVRSGSTDTPDAAATDPNGMGFYLVCGKRIPLLGGLSFRPSIGVVSGGSTALLLRPIAVSYHF